MTFAQVLLLLAMGVGANLASAGEQTAGSAPAQKIDDASMQPTLTLGRGSGLTTVIWSSKSQPGGASPFVTYLATYREGEPVRPTISLDFRDLAQSLAQCRKVVWTVDDARISPNGVSFETDDPHKLRSQQLTFGFSVDALATMARGNTVASICEQSFTMDARAAKALELFVGKLRHGAGLVP